jgi:ribonuclease BN (tRNA processing enzyme)
VKLTFLGTRGEIEARTRRHIMHSSLMVSYRGRKVMVDCGADWLGRIDELKPKAIVVTHAHPDHAWGLKEGAPCPVYATKEAWRLMEGYGIGERRVVEHRSATGIEGMIFEAFPVEHSIRAPAVGYRISAGGATMFYAPDVVYVHDRQRALRGARLYAGDGATVTRSLVRRRNEVLIGHAPIRTQLTWCQKEGVARAIFTHCGTELVVGDERILLAKIEEMGWERGVQVEIAHDGMEVVLR